MQSPDALPCTPLEVPLTARAHADAMTPPSRVPPGQGCRTASAASCRNQCHVASVTAGPAAQLGAATVQSREGFTTVPRHAAKDSQCEASQASPASCWVLKAAVA